jgi:hypothetical protein
LASVAAAALDGLLDHKRHPLLPSTGFPFFISRAEAASSISFGAIIRCHCLLLESPLASLASSQSAISLRPK